jgi:NADH pyrophosphatase NudC (nudix superfamily)
VEAKDEKIVVPDVSELKDVKWYSRQEALDTIDYENAKDIFKKGLEKLGL